MGSGDFEEFKKHADSSMTALSPDTHGQLITGLKFHEFNINVTKQADTRVRVNINNVQSRMLGQKAALTTCTILKQVSNSGEAVSYFLKTFEKYYCSRKSKKLMRRASGS